MTKQTSTTDKPVKRTRSGTGKKKLSVFNKFMQTEMARLKADQPEMGHRERFKLAADNWKTAEENPKQSTSS